MEYFVSNFDYYQPEAYMPKTDTYIEKNAMTNDELDMLRMAAVNSVLERRDTIIVASVACIYASSDPNQYRDMFFTIRVGEHIDRNDLLRKLVDRQYKRNDMDRHEERSVCAAIQLKSAWGIPIPSCFGLKCLTMRSNGSVKSIR